MIKMDSKQRAEQVDDIRIDSGANRSEHLIRQ